MSSAYLSIEHKPDVLLVNVKGQWVFDEVLALEEAVATVIPQPGQQVTFRCSGLEDIDIAGAWVLYDRTGKLSELGIKTGFTGFKAAHFKFLQHIIDAAAIRDYEEPVQKSKPRKFIRETVEQLGHHYHPH